MRRAQNRDAGGRSSVLTDTPGVCDAEPGSGFGEQNTMLKKNDEIILKIEDMGADGEASANTRE